MASTPGELAPLTTSSGLGGRVRALWQRRDTIRFLTSAALKAGHRNKVLGHLWNLLDPLMFMLVYFFVFGVLFGIGGSGRPVDFMLYILIGVLTYQFMATTISQAASCIRANRGLILEISFPKAIFPITVSLSRLYDYVWGLVVMTAFLLCAGVWPTLHFLWVPILAALMWAFTLGVALICAYLGAFFADTTNVTNVALRLMFYCSPIFYFVRDRGSHEAMSAFDNPWARFVYMLNPMACFLECFRDAMLWGTVPELQLFLYVAAVSVGTLFVGFVIFGHGEGRFAKYV